ncbi:Response regulator receiver domain-containing protein [Limimonas halophila]|uniref:Response regulator receiver domain-containing protein n=1 Tax=Limimonas halophila TaxID=1082479 RepID=A0A1G7RLS9_9PROT|nr:Response regulator receiver domain-containing protein [Limimonas halophila]
MSVRVLLVEDDRDFAESVALNLAEAGYALLGPATSGVDAFRVLEHQRPDVALVDVYLEGQLDGLFVGTQLAERGVPVVYLSGRFERVLREGREHAAAMLAKPVDAHDLVATLQRVLATA